MQLSEYNKANGIRPSYGNDDSDSDFEPSSLLKKKPKLRSTGSPNDIHSDVNGIMLTKFSELSDKLVHIEKTIEFGSSTGKNSVVEKYERLKQCFVCVICKSYVTFPAVISKCCTILLGCESCLAVWHEENDTCPYCRNQQPSTSGLASRYMVIPSLLPVQECLREAD